MKTKHILASVLLFACCCTSRADEPFLVKHTEIAVNVIGAVNKPSRITLPASATILDALAASGSATDGGNLKRVKVIHKSTAEKPVVTVVNVKRIVDGTASNIALRDGDTINVPTITYAVQ